MADPFFDFQLALQQSPLLQTILAVTTVLTFGAPWIYKGAPVPFYGRLLASPELSPELFPELLPSVQIAPSPNQPPVFIFGHPGTIQYSPAKNIPPVSHPSIKAPPGANVPPALVFGHTDFVCRSSPAEVQQPTCSALPKSSEPIKPVNEPLHRGLDVDLSAAFLWVILGFVLIAFYFREQKLNEKKRRKQQQQQQQQQQQPPSISKGCQTDFSAVNDGKLLQDAIYDQVRHGSGTVQAYELRQSETLPKLKMQEISPETFSSVQQRIKELEAQNIASQGKVSTSQGTIPVQSPQVGDQESQPSDSMTPSSSIPFHIDSEATDSDENATGSNVTFDLHQDDRWAQSFIPELQSHANILSKVPILRLPAVASFFENDPGAQKDIASALEWIVAGNRLEDVDIKPEDLESDVPVASSSDKSDTSSEGQPEEKKKKKSSSARKRLRHKHEKLREEAQREQMGLHQPAETLLQEQGESIGSSEIETEDASVKNRRPRRRRGRKGKGKGKQTDPSPAQDLAEVGSQTDSQDELTNEEERTIDDLSIEEKSDLLAAILAGHRLGPLLRGG